jgi:hypothetical protein
VKSGKRLDVPNQVHIKIRELIAKCWDQKPRKRPDFANIVKFLQECVPTFESGSAKTPSPSNNSNHSSSTSGDESEPYQLIPPDHYKKIGWYGTINRPEAVKILDTCPIGTFLVRYSSHAKGYVLSYRGQKQVEHIADIKQGADGEISVVKIDGGLRKFPNLLEYVKAMQEQKLITQPIPVSISQEESIYGRSTFDSSRLEEKKA